MNDQQDPIERFKEWYALAETAGVTMHDGASLATVGTDGAPSLRVVLLKDVDESGFVFYTNLHSRKAREMTNDNRAALCFWWPSIQLQVRIEGTVTSVSDAEADAYFATRARDSQLGAWASDQSSVLESRDELMAKFEQLEAEYEGKKVPRPPFWSGYRLVPQHIEFWTGMLSRLHDRDLYTRGDNGWSMKKLYP